MSAKYIKAEDLDDLAADLLPALQATLPDVTNLIVSLVDIPQPRRTFTDLHGPLHVVSLMFEDGAVVTLLDRAIPDAERHEAVRRSLADMVSRDRRGFARGER